MSLNPFQKIDDVGRRRAFEGLARGAAKFLAGALVTRGLVSADGSQELIELLVGLAIYAYTEYASWQAKQHAEREVAAASALPPSASRETIDVAARQGVDG